MDVASTSFQGGPEADMEEVENDMPGSNRKKPAARKNGPTPRNEQNEENAVDNGAEPDSTAAKRDLRKEQKKQVEAYLEREMVTNDYPKNARTPVARVFLELTELERTQNGRHSKGVFHTDADSKCVICHQATDADGETELIDCHGTMNGEMKGPERISDLNKQIREKHEKTMEQWREEAKDEKKPAPGLRLISDGQHACRSKFHMSCIMKYNAGDFFFQYSARFECQAKFLCPLHCCFYCNVNHQKQSAYGCELIDCAKCLRSFHIDCYPAGARDQYVTLNTSVGDRMFEMVICPCHPEELPSKSNKPNKDHVEIKTHLRGCFNDECPFNASSNDEEKEEAPPPLIKCETCIRSFHRGCCEVETIDGVPIPELQCEFCASKDVVPIGMPVLALWNTTFWLAKTVSWYEYPSTKRANDRNFERSGYTVVEWKTEEKLMSIIPVNHLTKLIENYIPLASNAVKKSWMNAFKIKNEDGYNAPYLSKTVYHNARTSKYFGSARPKLHDHHEVCQCKEKAGRGKCYDLNCVVVQVESECVPECGKSCQNRKISTGFVNKKLELRDTKKYGYGVFAREPIAKGEFLAEYVGEIIDHEEKQRRMKSISLSRDFQANHYMMELGSGLSVDATRYGNIARYINHCCEPNSRCSTKSIYSRRDKDTIWYETRTYLEASKPIAAGEEITFSYKMGTNEVLPVCQCGAPSCTGYMSQTNKKSPKPNKKSSKPIAQISAKKEATKKTEQTPKDARQAKKRDVPQSPSTSSAVPSKRFNTQASPMNGGRRSTARVAQSDAPTPAARPPPQVVPDQPVPAALPAPPAPPAPMPEQARRSSPRGRPTQPSAQQVRAPAPQMPAVNPPPAQPQIEEGNQEDVESTSKRSRKAKKRFQVEGY